MLLLVPMLIIVLMIMLVRCCALVKSLKQGSSSCADQIGSYWLTPELGKEVSC
jgi:hypothetical protein